MKNNLTYSKNGDYQIPNLTLGLDHLPDTLNKYGMLRDTHLQTNRKGTYRRMLMDNSLWGHLIEIGNTAEEQVDLMMEQMMESQGVTETLKAKDQMLWVQMVNNIKHQAEEIVLRELIYA